MFWCWVWPTADVVGLPCTAQSEGVRLCVVPRLKAAWASEDADGYGPWHCYRVVSNILVSLSATQLARCSRKLVLYPRSKSSAVGHHSLGYHKNTLPMTVVT